MHTKLLRSQRNEMFQLASEAGLEITDFEWLQTHTKWIDSGGLVDMLLHKPTGYYFVFDRIVFSNGDVKAKPRYTPGPENVVEHSVNSVGKWLDVRSQAESWFSDLKREALEPDFWKAHSDDKKLVAAKIEDVENSPFNPEEQKRVKSAIADLRAFLHTTASHSDEKLQFIDSRLKHLEEASSRLGRKDWITLAMGTITNIVVGVSLAPDAARELVRTAGALFGWVVGGVQLLL